MIDPIVQHLREGGELAPAEITAMAEFLLDPAAPDSGREALLEALAAKGETPAEIRGFVEVFLDRAIDPEVSSLNLGKPTIDVCGTGGDKLGLFNVSSTVMFVVAAAGAAVVKHGNRGITSKSGGADVLEALGVSVDLPPEGFLRCLEKAGVGFMFAPHYHPAFKAVANARKNLATRGVRTIFNLVGPLLNPARPSHQLTGVFAREWCTVFAEILGGIGRQCAWVVHGTTATGGAVDEMSLMGPTRVCQAGVGVTAATFEIRLEDHGLRPVPHTTLTGGDALVNAEILEAILDGRDTGPKLDMVLLNAGAAIAAAELAPSLDSGIAMARELVASGAALDRLRLLQECSRA